MTEPNVPLSSGADLPVPGHADDGMTNLPPGYDYTMKSCTADKVVFTVNAASEDELMEWLAQYSDLTKTTWRVRRNSHPCCATVLFRTQRRCQHQTWPRSKTANTKVSSKNTNCPAWMKLIVRAADKRTKEPAYSIVQLNNQHNHPTMSRYALSKRDVSQDARTKLLSLFADGYGPTAAVKVLRSEFRLTSSDTQSAVFSADRAIIPTISYATSLYRKTIQRPYGPRNDPAKLRNRQVKRTRPNIKRTAPKVNHGVNSEVMANVSPDITNDDSLSASDGETPMDVTDNYNTNNCQVILVTAEDWADGMPLGEQCEVSSSAAWIQSLLDDATPPETEQTVVTEQTVERWQTVEVGPTIQETCDERLVQDVNQTIPQTDKERTAHDAKQTIQQTDERLAEDIKQTIPQTGEERLAQAVTVAMRSLSISINAMVNSCTPSVDLITAIWKCKSRVDSERTTSGAIKLLQSLDHRLPTTEDSIPTTTVQPKTIVQPTTIQPTAVQPTSNVQPRATVQPKATVQPMATVQLRAIQPKATIQPRAPVQPMTIVQPTIIIQPIPIVQPRATVQPTIIIQPIPIVQPRATVQTRATIQPTATVQLKATVQPTIIIQPIPIIQPRATVQPRALQPKATEQPTATVQPKATVQPTMIVQPTATTQVSRASKRVANRSPSIVKRVA